MNTIHRYGALFKVSASWSVWDAVLNRVFRQLIIVANSITEVFNFVHFKPYSAELYSLSEDTQHCIPVLSDVRTVEVWEHNINWPDIAYKWLSLGALDVCIVLNERVISQVVLIRPHSNACIHYWYKSDSLLENGCDELSDLIEAFCDGEVFVFFH